MNPLPCSRRFVGASTEVAEATAIRRPQGAPGDHSYHTDDGVCNIVGGVISPLLSNIYLGFLDRIWESRCKHLGILVRYADDLVVLCKRESQCQEALRRVRIVMERLGLELHPEKTRVVDLSHGKESFQFLGWTVRKRRSVQRNPRWHFVQRWPSPKAMKRIRERVHELTTVRGRQTRNMGKLVQRLNPVLRGWGNYFRTGNADREFHKVDEYVYGRVLHWQWRRGGQRTRFRFDRWPRERLYEISLHRLRGTVKYPKVAAPRKPCQESSPLCQGRCRVCAEARITSGGSPWGQMAG